MAAPKIFVTGTTGYIGGDALHVITKAHPEFDITCLVRNSDKGAQVASQYPKVKLVYSDLDDAALIEEEAKKADIVLDCANADHEVSANAIAKGLAAHSSDRPGCWIHTSGTGILLFTDMQRKIFGEASTKIYDDWDGIGEMFSLPDFAPHRTVDKIVQAAGVDLSDRINTAIVCPPAIYGKGRGPGNQRSIQVYELARCTLEKKQGIQVGAGKTFWSNVHIFDLSDCYLRLVEDAAMRGGRATWGKEGYYFTENGEQAWGQVSKGIASAAHKQGFLSSEQVVTVSAEEADKLTPHGSMLFGANSRSKAIRARKLLGWSPKERSLNDELPDVVASEARRLGLVEGHAAKVAGG
ncbi:MAG: hypothetical protein M1830_007020 [Pleopsidium flavum]|nr:MAG: hypothetical protein M1830_007020 [Pleopsidium flavum]